MAISPNVNAYMQQGQGGGAQSAEQMFNSQFTNQAYNTLQAKFPGLMNSLVTMKVLSSNLEEGTAFGVFVLKKGADVAYIPVVMSGGGITSCEMFYDKAADQFIPITDATIKEFMAAVSYSDPSILGKKSPYVEDTRHLFRNMIRPPASSNVVLATSREGVAALPNRYKAVLSSYLENENPQLLGKIAEFYDVEHLAHKLACRPEAPPVQEAPALPSFLSLDKLTKEAAKLLSRSERAFLMQNGFLIKGASEGGTLHVSTEDTLQKDIETVLRLETYPDMRDTAGKSNTPFFRECPRDLGEPVRVERGKLLQQNSAGVRFADVLLCGKDIIADRTYMVMSRRDTVLVADRSHEVSAEYLDGFSVIFPIEKLLSRLREATSGREYPPYVHIHLLVPARKSGWLFLDTEDFLGGSADKWQSSEVGGDVYYAPENRYNANTIVATDKIAMGYLMDGSNLLVPRETRCMLSTARDAEPLPCVTSFDVFRKLVCTFGAKLVRNDNGAGVSITDMKEEKTASFRDTTEAAAWLHDKYGMNNSQVKTVLASRQTYVFPKLAFGDMGHGMAPEIAQGMEPGAYPQGSMEQPVVGFDPSYLNDFAELGDEEMMDTGILAAFAQDPDIKALLVDYLPDFMQAQDRLGRIILMFGSQKEDLEDFYGSEKYSTLLSSCRKIFQVLGDLVASLKTYVNMT